MRLSAAHLRVIGVPSLSALRSLMIEADQRPSTRIVIVGTAARGLTLPVVMSVGHQPILLEELMHRVIIETIVVRHRNVYHLLPSLLRTVIDAKMLGRTLLPVLEALGMISRSLLPEVDLRFSNLLNVLQGQSASLTTDD
jgi:hypothetical protein